MTHSPPRASRLIRLIAAALVLAGPAVAAHAQEAPPARPVTRDHVGAGDVAATPVDDLNLRHKGFPALLVKAQQAPYDTAGLSSCETIGEAVGELDAVLGEDFDLVAIRKQRLQAGKLAREVVGLFIPFRGVIREASGANGERRRMAELILSGVARRSYLKGLGEARGCAYPARPADEDTRFVIAAFEPAYTTITPPAPTQQPTPPPQPILPDPPQP